MSTRIRVGEPAHNEATDFLYEEAHLLEQGLFEDWLQLLDEQVSYTAPVRRTRLRHEGTEFDPCMAHYEDSIDTLRQRVRRLRTRYAYAEDPPSRTRRLVTNIRVHRGAEDELAVSSALLVLRNRGDEASFHLIAAGREDVLRRHPDGLKLLRRTILLDSTTLPTANLAILL